VFEVFIEKGKLSVPFWMCDELAGQSMRIGMSPCCSWLCLLELQVLVRSTTL
jgi:hypothetical protein